MYFLPFKVSDSEKLSISAEIQKAYSKLKAEQCFKVIGGGSLLYHPSSILHMPCKITFLHFLPKMLGSFGNYS